MTDDPKDLPETVIACLHEIEAVATSMDGEADKRKRIVRLVHRAESLIVEPAD